MTASSLILAFITAQRLIELWFSRRNTARLLALGGYEHAPAHYPFLVLVHASWLAGLWLLAWSRPINPWWLGCFGVLQAMRIWVLVTLGRRWTTRIIVLPGAPLMRSGPYRIFSHPNYLVVVGEIAVLPLVFSLPYYALLFTIVNAILLFVRIRAETAALSALCSTANKTSPGPTSSRIA